jgi:hypothetical protein
MCASKAKGFLLEFKKNWEGRVSERVKEKYKLLQEQPTLIAQGEKCHLLGYGKDIEHRFCRKRRRAKGLVDELLFAGNH